MSGEAWAYPSPKVGLPLSLGSVMGQKRDDQRIQGSLKIHILSPHATCHLGLILKISQLHTRLYDVAEASIKILISMSMLMFDFTDNIEVQKNLHPFRPPKSGVNIIYP